MRQLNNFSIEPNVAPGIDFMPLIGEAAWHALTLDPSIVDVSRAHLEQLVTDLRANNALKPGLKILEVAAYAHITGYMFPEKFDADITLFDVSRSTLSLGRDLAVQLGLSTKRVRCVVGDFHKIPFDTGEFDVVYIASALHHTWRYREVISELLRVTRIGGHLVLENEPCRRELCFYQFRTNRPDDLIGIETHLQELGLLRTVAEPYLGSRPEQLFGMTENQEMHLGDLLGLLGLSSELVFLGLNPSICMGFLEKALDTALIKKPTTQAKEILKNIIGEALKQAREKILDHTDSTMLPQEVHVDAMIIKVVKLLEKADYGRGKLPLVSLGNLSPKFKETLTNTLYSLIKNDPALALNMDRATLFGAAVKVIARKRYEGSSRSNDYVKVVHETGIEQRFDADMHSLMNPQNLIFPHLQLADLAQLNKALGESWNIVVNSNGLRVVNPIVPQPYILTRCLEGNHVLIYARVYGVGQDKPWTLYLTVQGERRASICFEKSDSALLAVTFSNAVGPIRVEFESDGIENVAAAPFNLSFFGVLEIKS